MSNIPKLSQEIKRTLLSEKEKKEEQSRKYITRNAGFRKYMIYLAVYFFAFIPFITVQVYVLNFPIPDFLGSQTNVILFFMAYATFLYILFVWLMRRKLKNTCKLICFHTAVSAAEELEKGNLIQGSYYVKKLFEFIKKFSEEEKVQIGHFKSTPLKDLFLGHIEKLHEQSSAVGKAVLESDSDLTSQFSNHLYFLANSLFTEQKEKNYNVANETMKFFRDNSKKYFEPSTYLQRHKKVNSSVRIFSEIGKIILAPVLLFVLWLIFGYGM